MTRSIFTPLLTCLLASLIFSGPARASAATPCLRIMPLGDSITRGKDDEGYRTALFDELKTRGYKFHFVGSLCNGPAGFPECHHEGHSGWVIQQLTDQIDEWISNFKPNVILLMIGSNDIEGSVDVDHMEDRFQTLVNQILVDAPKAQVFVSEISLIRNPEFDRLAREFNPKIERLVSALKARGDRVTFVPMHDVLALDEIDELDHPNAVGNKKMADRWMTYLDHAL